MGQKDPQDAVEELFLRLWGEFPDLNPQQVAQLVRDALLNAKVREEAFYYWASVETAERIRRSLLLNEARATRREYDRIASEMYEAEPQVVRPWKCPGCAKKVRGDVNRCSCGHVR